MIITRDKVREFYAKNPRLRHLPIFGEFLENLSRAKTDLSARVKADYFLAPLTAILELKKLHQIAPRKYYGGFLLSILGWQVVRILYLNLKWKIRQTLRANGTHAAVVETLNKDGVAILNDVFNEEEIQQLVADFQQLSPKFTPHFEEFRVGLVVPTRAYKPWDKILGSQVAQDLIVNNTRLNEIIEQASGHKVKFNTEVSYIEYESKLDQLGGPQADGQDVLHADVIYPSYKVFIYVTDTDEKNGAFRFCPGSHKLTLSRLYVEYLHSIRYYLGLRRGSYKAVEVRESERKLLGLNEISQNGKAGTVIIFNTMGFHRRGDFTDSNIPYRRLIMSNYRYLDTLSNSLGLSALS